MQILRNIKQFSEVIKFSVSGVMDASKGIKTNIIFTLDNGSLKQIIIMIIIIVTTYLTRVNPSAEDVINR